MGAAVSYSMVTVRQSDCGGTKRKCNIQSFMHSLRKELPLLSSPHSDTVTLLSAQEHMRMLNSLA